MPGAGDHTAPALLSNDGMKRESLIARAVDWVFGYDFFLSYSHGDGMRLPRRLKERLEQAGFRVFLDQTEYVAGADLRRETRRQVVKSRKVVVIGRPCALKSEWVRREVDVALAHDKIPVILNINGAVESAAADAALATMARERHWLRLTETLDDPDGEPPDRTVTELVRGFNHTRQETKRQRIFAIAAAVLAITAGIATWQAVEATRARTVAEAERDRAQRVLAQVVGNANRRVEALSQRVKRERESVRVGQARPIPVSLPEPTSRSPLQLANDLIAKATTLLASGDLRGARSPFEQALQIIESSKEGQSGEPEWQLARFSLYNGLAKAALAAGDPDGALAALTKSLAVAEARVAVEPAALEWRQKRAVLHQRMGELHLEQGRLVEAGQEYQEAIALWRELASVPELLPRARRELAFALAQRGDLELKRSNSRMALTLYQESVSLLEQLTGSGTPGTDLQRELSVGYQQIADALLAAGRADEALVWADKDLAVIQGAVADGASPAARSGVELRPPRPRPRQAWKGCGSTRFLRQRYGTDRGGDSRQRCGAELASRRCRHAREHGKAPAKNGSAGARPSCVPAGAFATRGDRCIGNRMARRGGGRVLAHLRFHAIDRPRRSGARDGRALSSRRQLRGRHGPRQGRADRPGAGIAKLVGAACRQRAARPVGWTARRRARPQARLAQAQSRPRLDAIRQDRSSERNLSGNGRAFIRAGAAVAERGPQGFRRHEKAAHRQQPDGGDRRTIQRLGQMIFDRGAMRRKA
jgi:tetratricopeptide (TPR) repeat protein